MTHDQLVEASLLYGTLTQKNRELARKSLAGMMRTMGLRSTLEWLQDKDAAEGRQLFDRLVHALDLQGIADLDEKSALEQLELDRRAHALCEAMHIFARAEHLGGS